jgi:hypothetical protein
MVGAPTGGSVVINLDNTVTFTPNAGFQGATGFTYSISDNLGGSASAYVSIIVGQPQLLEGEAGLGAAALSTEQLQSVISEGIAHLRSAGYDVSTLYQATFIIVDLHTVLLGVAYETTIWIDQDAAGHGWYLGGASRAFDGVDLLTVVTHELGHLLGFDSIDPAVLTNDWMTATLPTGVRRLPGSDFAIPEAVVSAVEGDPFESTGFALHAFPIEARYHLPDFLAVVDGALQFPRKSHRR